MKTSQFEAKTFGVGELIMQRKLFVVPPHQRSFAWGKEAIEEFIDDIESARTNGAVDYFIGLVVIQGSPEGEWILLDGQQRLSTVSLIYAAIRYWFHAAGFEEDAKQINHDYLGVRRLGGDYSSRMMLNAENRLTFEQPASKLISDRELTTLAQALPKKSSNRLLLDAAISAREWIYKIAGDRSSSNDEGAKNLYALARFLDSKLKIVAVEVSSEVDAYILFEALNDRGVALSALDLIKNHIFSKNPTSQQIWDELMKKLREYEPEDFLKVFWTSRYGNIQKSQIFRGVKDKYNDADAVALLLRQMDEDALLLSAIYDDDHPFWAAKDDGIRNQLFLLRYLDSKQARPVLISILRNIGDPFVALQMVGVLSAALFRFQVVGRGRTGVVEKVIGRLCVALEGGSITDAPMFRDTLSELLTSDSELSGQFLLYTDLKYSRIAYVLAEDAVFVQLQSRNQGAEIEISPADRVAMVRQVVERTRLIRIEDPETPYWTQDGVEPFRLVGNYKLESVPEMFVDVPLFSQQIREGAAEDVIFRTEEIAKRACRLWSPAYWGI